MILDSIDHASLYGGIGRGFGLAFKFLREKNLAELAPGRYEIDGAEVYATVSAYETLPAEKGEWEAHRKYADIQYLVEGTEKMGCANLETMTVKQEYAEAGDCLTLNGAGNFFLIKPRDFVVFLPHDAHMPGLAAANPQKVKKVVVKVKIV